MSLLKKRIAAAVAIGALGMCSAADAAQKIVAPQRRVAIGQPFELVAWKNSLHLPPYGFVEAVTLLTQTVIDQEKTAE